MKKFIFIIFLTILSSGISAQSIEEKNKEVAVKYLNAYMEADLSTLLILLDRAYRHYLFDISRENYEGFINLVKKKGQLGDWSVHEIEASGDKVFIRWTFKFHHDIYNGANWITIENSRIMEDREYYKKIN